MNVLSTLNDSAIKLLSGLGAVAGGLAMYLTPEQLVSLLGAKGPGALLLAGSILAYLRDHYRTKATAPATPPADPPSVIKAHWLATLVGLLVTGVTLLSLSACATKPTPTQQVGLDALTAAAVAITVQRDTSDPAVWSKRAALIVSVASQVRPLATDETVSVPALAAAVGPLLDQAKLAPGERVAANTLVTALATVIEANTSPDSPTAATVAAVLDSAVKAASVYLPMGPQPTASTIF